MIPVTFHVPNGTNYEQHCHAVPRVGEVVDIDEALTQESGADITTWAVDVVEHTMRPHQDRIPDIAVYLVPPKDANPQ